MRVWGDLEKVQNGIEGIVRYGLVLGLQGHRQTQTWNGNRAKALHGFHLRRRTAIEAKGGSKRRD